MREIKFRAWTQRDKTMHRPLDIREIMKVGWVSKDCILMQYTGLLDKNGVEIYEGDIIELDTGKEKFVAPVVFNQENACFDLNHPNGYHGHWGLNMGLIDACNYRVIGNIYQNPELLKD